MRPCRALRGKVRGCMRRLAIGVASLALVVLLVGLAFLVEAHREIRSLDPALPEPAALSRAVAVPNAPVALWQVLTASQTGQGGAALSHPAFVLEWSDGRLFLIDTGMDREGAREFGGVFELLLGSAPIETFGPPGELLAAAAERVAGVAFTHLHLDHTGGLASLCVSRSRELPVFQTPWQAELGNYTTAPGREDLEAASCARFERLRGGPVFAIPGFPGLVAVQAGGHTPGSSIFAAKVRDRIWIFSGDITNERSALLENRPKSALYSLLVTPEAPGPLAKLRRWLGGLDAAPGFSVVVSHDGGALEASGIPAWSTRGVPTGMR